MSDAAQEEEPVVNDPNPEEGEGSKEALNQEDVDRLMQEAGGVAEGVVYKSGGGCHDKKVSIESFDFYSSSFLTESELRKLRIKHEQFCHYLAARLSLSLRTDFKLKLNSLQAFTYNKFTEFIQTPAYINIFSIKGLSGVGLLDIRPKMAMTIVNRMLGGRGNLIQDDRALTEIEASLIDDFSEIILEDWCKQWEDFGDLEATIEGKETDVRFLNVAAQDTKLLILELDAEIGACAEKITIALPDYMIEPIVRNIKKLDSQYLKKGVKDSVQQWRKSYSDIDVPVYAEWKAPELTIRDVINLRPGDVFEMPRSMISSTEVRLMNTPCFIGEIMVDRDHVAVKLSSKIKPENN